MCKALTRIFTPAMPKPAAMPVAPPPPAVPEPPAPPATGTPSESPAARDAAEKARIAAQKQQGRGTTILTGNQGLVGTEMIGRPTATRMLLGG